MDTGLNDKWRVDVTLISTTENASHIVGVRFIAGVHSGCLVQFDEIFRLGRSSVCELDAFFCQIFG